MWFKGDDNFPTHPKTLSIPRNQRCAAIGLWTLAGMWSGKNLTDGDKTTTWRCDGTATGETITLKLPKGTQVAEVGLVPGYAKTDPKSGADRYAENNRITRVRWTLDDGTQVEQELDPSPTNRSVQSLRVPRTETDEITLEILETKRGPRNTTAISTVTFGAAS